MPSFGVLVIDRPGRHTKVRINGLAGHSGGDLGTFTEAEEIAKIERLAGNQAHVLVLFDADEGDGSPQLEVYDRKQAEENGCLTDEEAEAGKEAK